MNKSVSTINSALYRVSLVQKKVRHLQVTEHLFVTQVVDAARRILRRPPDRKKPLVADQVMRIISRLEKGSLADVQVAVIFAMGFFGFLRCNDLSNVAVDDAVELILGDPGAVSRVGRKGATKVFKHRWKSPWVPTLTGPFPNGQANAGS